jgi:hypothetical protein
MFTFNKTIRDAEHFMAHLRAGGFNVSGVAVTGPTTVYVEPMLGETKNPTSLVNSYVPKDYYEFTAADRQERSIDILWMKTYAVKRDGVDVINFTVTKKDGRTDQLKPENDRLDIHWHGARIAYVSEKVIILAGGIGHVSVGKVWVQGGGILEAVHPQEGARRATAYVKYEL